MTITASSTTTTTTSNDTENSSSNKDVLSFRNLRSIFEEEGLTDMSANHVDYIFLQHYKNHSDNSEDDDEDKKVRISTRLASSPLFQSRIGITQKPKLAARITNNDNNRGNITEDEFFFGHGSTEKSSATGATVWDSSVVVCRYLEQAFFPVYGEKKEDEEKNNFKHPRNHCYFLELGSGTGLVGCVLRRLLLLLHYQYLNEKKKKKDETYGEATKSVMCTDRGEMIPLLQQNLLADIQVTDIDITTKGSSSKCTNSTEEIKYKDNMNDNDIFQTDNIKVTAVPYHWGESITPILSSSICKCTKNDSGADTTFSSQPTFILAIDCIYDVDVVPRLVSSLRMLLSNEGDTSSSLSTQKKVALISTDETYRRPHAFELFTRLVIEEEGMIMEEISTSECLEDDFYRESVHLFWLYYK